jgi:hypothetical protein
VGKYLHCFAMVQVGRYVGGGVCLNKSAVKAVAEVSAENESQYIFNEK